MAHTAGEILRALDLAPSRAVEAHGDEIALLRAARRAMATTFEVLLPFGTPMALEAAEAALDEIDRLEAQLTVYRDDSEISQINHRAYAGPVRVEESLFALLNLAVKITAETNGAFDITTGPLIKAWGFYRHTRRLPSGHERADVLTRVGMKHVHFNAEHSTVAFDAPGVEINLGSIGKGYALDRVADLLRRDWNLSSALLHGGHSSVYAMGCAPGSTCGWSVGIRHPWDPEQRLAVVHLCDQALGTSAATFQHLEYAGRKLGHIIDPRTGWPADGMASASAIAPTGAEADALATAFYVLGEDQARAYCDAHPGIGAVLLPGEEGARPVVLNIDPDNIDLGPSND
jgi:thiamine biosynthesis lipoprotein